MKLKCPFHGCNGKELLPRSEKYYEENKESYTVVCKNEYQSHLMCKETGLEYLVKFKGQ